MAQPDPACENWTINQLWREQQAWTGISLHIPSWKLEMPGIVTVSTERVVMGTMIVLWFNCVLRLLCYTCVMISVYCSTKSRSHELPMADWRWMPLHTLPARQSPSHCYVKTIQCQIYQISLTSNIQPSCGISAWTWSGRAGLCERILPSCCCSVAKFSARHRRWLWQVLWMWLLLPIAVLAGREAAFVLKRCTRYHNCPRGYHSQGTNHVTVSEGR